MGLKPHFGQMDMFTFRGTHPGFGPFTEKEVIIGGPLNNTRLSFTP